MTTVRPLHEGPQEISEATMVAVRQRIGIPSRHGQRSHNEVCSSDSFRHFAFGYGDENPLYADPDYSNASVWEGPIAPPMYPISAGKLRKVSWSEAQTKAMSGGDPLAGIGQYMCGERWLFLRPIRPGAELQREQALHAAELKTSAFGGGVGALLSHRVSWEGSDGSPYAFRFLDFWHADRDKSASAGKYRDLQRPQYTEDDLARIDACYEAETVRGSLPRLISEVEVGEKIGPIAKGPLSVTDIICYHVAIGFGGYGGGSGKVAYKARRRMPKFYQLNDLGFWDSAQRCHWEDAWAQRMGHPAAYDYGAMRTNWMVHLVTNWMGDNAWLWTLQASVRKFNYMGDVHFVSGKVTAVDHEAGTVDLVLRGVNQREEVTCEGRATVILPRRLSERVELPTYDLSDIPVAEAP